MMIARLFLQFYQGRPPAAGFGWFRRFTETMLEKAKLHPNWCRKILGKTIKGEENPYSQPKMEELREAYRAAIPYLELTRTPSAQTLGRIESLEQRNIELEHEIATLKENNLKLKTRLNGTTLTGDQVVELLKRIEKLEKQAPNQR